MNLGQNFTVIEPEKEWKSRSVVWIMIIETPGSAVKNTKMSVLPLMTLS